MPEPSSETVVEFFWRPGCGFCSMLDRKLGKAGVAVTKRNIWEDPDAAAIVRSVARGNETVPTVRVGPVAMVNPSAREVLAAVEAHAPHRLHRS